MPDNTFSVFKTDDDQRLVFGWASIAITVDGEQLEDRQKDIIDPEDLEEAAYEYVLNFRDTGEEHLSTMRKKGKLVESCVLTAEKQKAMGIPEGTVPVGWWIGFKIEDDAAWQRVKNGTYRMFSIEGRASRIPVEKSQEPTGCGVLVVRDGKVLAGTRREKGHKLCGPGGGIEPGETPGQAAIREAKEEFGIVCRGLIPLGVQDGGSKGKSAIFLCSDFYGTPAADEKEMTDARWVDPEEIEESEAFPPFWQSLKLLPKRTVAKTFLQILKFNQNHDNLGRFSSSGGGGASDISLENSGLTHQSLGATAGYTGTVSGTIINDGLRNGFDDVKREYGAVIDRLDGNMETVKKPVTLYRGVSGAFLASLDGLDPSMNYDQMKRAMAGKEFTDKGYASTSHVDNSEKNPYGNFIMKIKANPGTKAIWTGNDEENEVLLGRNQKYKITDYRRIKEEDPWSAVVIECETVPFETTKKSEAAKTFDEVLKFNPFHDSRGRFASSAGFATYSANPKSKAGAMAIERSAQAGYTTTFNSHKESQGENVGQNYAWLNGGPGAKQLAAQGALASQKPKAPPKPKKNFDALGFADQDDADFHDLHSGAKYYAQQKLTPQQKAAAQNYLEATPEPGSLYSHSQNLNTKLRTGQPLTGKYQQTYNGMMSSMHNIGYNVKLTRYDHAGMVNSLLQKAGAGTDYEKMTPAAIKKALVGGTVQENKFLSTSYNDFKGAPQSTRQVFDSRAVKINYKVRADVQAMMPGNGPGGSLGEVVLSPNNRPGKITDVRLTGQMVRRKGTQTYNQPRIEIDIEI